MSSATTAPEFVPASLDATKWENVAPYYTDLTARTLNSAADLERLILDRSMLDATTGEAEANLYIEMTRHTDDPAVQKAYADFVSTVEPSLRKAAFTLDQKIVQSPFTKSLDTKRYAVYLRNLAVDVELFRAENVAIQTELSQLDQRYKSTRWRRWAATSKIPIARCAKQHGAQHNCVVRRIVMRSMRSTMRCSRSVT